MVDFKKLYGKILILGEYMKTCRFCKIDKEPIEFHKNNTTHDKLMPYCKACVNKRYNKNKDEITKRIRDKRAEDPVEFLLVGAKQRAKKQNIPFNVTSKDIETPTHCPILGIKLNYEGTGRGYGAKDDAASLDRVRNELGYVKGNTYIVSWRANRAKCFLTPEETQLLAKHYAKYLDPCKKF